MVEARAVADRAEVRLLGLAAHWADLHGHLDPADEGMSLPGMERLVQLGGDGTPLVVEFAPAELGAAVGISPSAADRLIGAALDLRHRLPKLWVSTQAGKVRPWVARKSAETTRNLGPDLMPTLDRRLARWAPSLGWGRLAALIDAAVFEADPAAAAKAARRAELAQGVWVGHSSEHGLKDIYLRTETPNAIWFDASIDRIAESLAAGVARPEGDGPITLDQARRWLGHCHVTVKPVLDLANQLPVDAYEVPERLREAIHLCNPVDIFPHGSNSSRRRDIDHTIAYRPPDVGGPPGQTAMGNLGPMTRFHHRIKTHSRWQVRQPFPGVYLWRSPLGHHYLVDPTGTRAAHPAA